MRRVALRLALLAVLGASSAQAVVVARGGPAAEASSRAPRAGRVLVVDDAGRLDSSPGGDLRARHAGLAATLSRHGLSRGASLWRSRAPSAPRFLVLESARPDFDPVAAAAELRATGLVRSAVPDFPVELHITPNDFDYGLQWYAQGSTGVDVSLPAAWDVEQGSPTVRIGIMDTGVDLGHPDLASKIWTNPGETAANGVDDDENGYVDDVHGWDFGDGDSDPNPHPVLDPSVFGLDVGFHGTFVAGIAAAATDNGEGIAGAAWNCPVVPLKVVNGAGDITLAAITEAFGYAATNHIEVLNISLGTSDSAGVAEYFQALVDAATVAGVLVVASAGNDGSSAPNFPAACTGVLSVAATDPNNARSSFSNFGPVVRIAAPGEAMWSALSRNYPVDEFSQLFYEVFFGWDGVRPYMQNDGTSFSSPLVAGVCALVRSRHPDWTPLTVGMHMVATGDVVAYDQPIGPKLNAQRAVSDAVASAPAGPFAHYSLSVAPNPASEGAIIRVNLPAGCSARVRVFDCTGRLTRDLSSGELPAGSHAIAWDGMDEYGNLTAAGVYVVQLDTPAGSFLRKLARTR